MEVVTKYGICAVQNNVKKDYVSVYFNPHDLIEPIRVFHAVMLLAKVRSTLPY